jgi:hypothetical protein
MDVKGLNPDSNPARHCRQFCPQKIPGSLVVFQRDDFFDRCSRSIEEKPSRLAAQDSPPPLEPADPIGFDFRTREQMGKENTVPFVVVGKQRMTQQSSDQIGTTTSKSVDAAGDILARPQERLTRGQGRW